MCLRFLRLASRSSYSAFGTAKSLVPKFGICFSFSSGVFDLSLGMEAVPLVNGAKSVQDAANLGSGDVDLFQGRLIDGGLLRSELPLLALGLALIVFSRGHAK